MVLPVFERIRDSARQKKAQLQKAVSTRVRRRRQSSQKRNRSRSRDRSRISDGASSRSSTLINDDRSVITTLSVSTVGSNRHSLTSTTGDESESTASQTGKRSRARTGRTQRFSLADKDYSHASTATLTKEKLNSVESVVFLQYQGETKRAVLPIDSTVESSRTALRSIDDLRAVFIKSFPDELPMEYLRSPNVKIYIQDPSKNDFFYELDDLKDIKDRSVLKLHESSTRPNSPPPPPTQPSLADTADHLRTSDRSLGTGYTRYQRNQSTEDMNYFSEPEFDASGDYRLQKSVSSSNYGTGTYQRQNRQYATLDRYYSGYRGNGTTAQASRSTYAIGPPKPDRNFGPGVPSGGRLSVRGSYSPPTHSESSAYGHSSEQDQSFSVGRAGYRDYIPSPVSEAAVDALYQQRHGTNRISRSGTATPVIDEEARVRMMNMEKQLASLSSLVHSALMSKGVSDNVYKDMEMMRREIFGSDGPPSSSGGTRDDASDSGSVSRFSDLSSDKGSYQSNTDKDGHTNSTSAPFSSSIVSDSVTPSRTPVPSMQPSSIQLSPEARNVLRNAKCRVNEVQGELKNLRRMAQLNAQCSRDILKDAFDRLKVILNTNKHLHIFAAQAHQQNLSDANWMSGDRKWISQEEERYLTETKRVERGLSTLEREIEDLRQRVISGQRKLRMSEVESFTDTLTQLGRSAASMKNNFPGLENRLKNVMTSDMEKVVREEKFIKEEPTRLDNALKRCKKLASTMVTMKKLAMVQDPSAYHGNSKRPPLPSKTNSSSESEGKPSASSPPPSSMLDHRVRQLSPLKETSAEGSSQSVNGGLTRVTTPSRAAAAANGGRDTSSHPLDNLLEELQNAAKQASGRTGGILVGSKNGNGEMNNEKRVGFADEVRVRHCELNDSAESDTIKKSPRNGVSGIPNHNIDNTPIYRTSSSLSYTCNRGPSPLATNYNPTLNYTLNRVPNLITTPSDRRSVSPSPMAASFRAAIPFLHGGKLGLPIRSSTPTSVTSEPAVYHSDTDSFYPPPPPRSSSRNAVSGSPLLPRSSTSRTPTGTPSSIPTVMSFKSEFEKKQRFFSSGSAGQTPMAIVQTNAMDDDNRYTRSASSSESINSQDGQRRKGIGSTDTEKTPPKNRQERELELMNRSGQNRYVKFQVPDHR